MSQIAVEWVRSTFCSDHSCVVAGMLDDDIVVANSNNIEAQRLQFSRREWEEFLAGVESGDFQF